MYIIRFYFYKSWINITFFNNAATCAHVKKADKKNGEKFQIDYRKDFFPFMMILGHPKRAVCSFH